MCMYALTPFVFTRGVIAPKWFAHATFLPQNGSHAQYFCPISLSHAIAPIQIGRSGSVWSVAAPVQKWIIYQLCRPRDRLHTLGSPRHAHGTAKAQCRRATTAPPICLGVPSLCHSSAYGTPALCLGPPLFAPTEACLWPVTHLNSNITVCYCNASHPQTHAHRSPKAKLLLFPTCWLLIGTPLRLCQHRQLK